MRYITPITFRAPRVILMISLVEARKAVKYDNEEYNLSLWMSRRGARKPSKLARHQKLFGRLRCCRAISESPERSMSG